MKKECKKVEKLFGAYIYNIVTPTERAYVEDHISKCPNCASDLFSRQAVLGTLKPYEEIREIPQRVQDDFALNVYKRIALDSLKRQSRRVHLQRYVLQPSFATLMIIFGLATFFLRMHPGQFVTVVKEPVPVVVKTEENAKKDIRASSYVDEFFQREGVEFKAQPAKPAKPAAKVADAKSKTLDEQKPSLETPNLVSGLAPDPKSLLEEANFIHFSLGDRKRAMSQYQKLVDNYPNTEAAAAAGEMIKSIRDFEYRVQNEELSLQTVDLEI